MLERCTVPAGRSTRFVYLFKNKMVLQSRELEREKSFIFAQELERIEEKKPRVEHVILEKEDLDRHKFL